MKSKISLTALSLLIGISTTADANTLSNQPSHLIGSNTKNSCVISPVQATSEVEFDNLNLSSNETAPSGGTFDPNNSMTYNFVSEAMIYDALGVSHLLNLFFIKTTTENIWSAAVVIDNQTITIGHLTYATNGELQSATGLDNVVWTPNNLSPEVLNINLSCSTQNAGIENPGTAISNGYSVAPNFHPTLMLHKIHLKSSCSHFASIPQPTTEVKLNVNLSASDSAPSVSVIQPTDPTTYNFKDTVMVYDSLGAPYNLSLYFAKDTHNGKWNVSAYLYQTYLGSGEIQFDSHGMISSTSGLDNLSWVTYSGAVSPQLFKVDMTCSTQYGFADENVETPWQDGSPGQPSVKKNK